MGLISWIKDKYYEHQYQKACQLYSEGDTGDSIEILKSILDKYPDAPSTLLDIYHSQIKKNNRNVIAVVADLYNSHNSLASQCVSFVDDLTRAHLDRVAVDYCQALYIKGLTRLLSPFIDYSVKIVTASNSNVSDLKSLSKNPQLLKRLSDTLFAKTQTLYNNKGNLTECKRLCDLIRPFCTTKEFYILLSNVRCDLLVSKFDHNTIDRMDMLFTDAQQLYHLSGVEMSKLTQKTLDFAKSLFSDKSFEAALQISQRLLNRYSEARCIYKDAAFKLYTSSSKGATLINSECLYKCLGTNNSELVQALEPFIAFGSHQQKYVKVVQAELQRLIHIDVQQTLDLFNRAWGFSPCKELISTLLTIGDNQNHVYFSTHILNSNRDILKTKSYLNTYLSELTKYDDLEFVVSTIESILDKSIDVKSEYEKQIIRLYQKAKSKSRKRIEIIIRGLTKIESNNLYEKEATALNDYIEGGHYDSIFASKVAISLIGKHDLAETLEAKILVEEAKNINDSSLQEEKLRKALSYRTRHNTLFNEQAYSTLLPEIEKMLINLAKSLYKNEEAKSVGILYLLRDNKLSWYYTYASLYLKNTENLQPSEEIAKKISSIIGEGRGIKTKIKSQLWEKYVIVRKAIIKSNEIVNSLEDLRSIIDTKCDSDNKQVLFNDLTKELCGHLNTRARNHEKEDDFNNAITDYQRIIYLDKKYNGARERVCICKLKKGCELTEMEESEIEGYLTQNKNALVQRDLAYRWCIYLMMHKRMEHAEEINNRILGGDSEISQICLEEKIAAKQVILDNVNSNIVKLNNSKLTPEEAISFGRSISATLKDIELIVKVSTQKASALKEAIRIYAIEKFYEKEDYIQCFQGLKVQDSTYLSDPVALRNIAIMALNIAESGKLTQRNFKEILSVWITAIYQQKLFVNSLDYTSWDDPYTFSLSSAFGRLESSEMDSLPDNVNYEFPEDNIVSIQEVQKTLLLRMETAINGNAAYEDFFNSELNALDKLAEQNLDKPCVLVTPFLMSLSKVYANEVTSSLSFEAEQNYDNKENILELGCLYGLANGDFGEYNKACNFLEKLISDIESKKKTPSSTLKTYVASISKFASLNSKLISCITTSLNNDISSNVDYKKFNTTYVEIVKLINDDTVSFVFSNYINQQIVKAINENQQTMAQCASVLFELYLWCECNPHLKRNAENLIGSLIHNYITNNEDENLPVLDRVLSSTRVFDSFVVKALTGDGQVPEEMMIMIFSSNAEKFEQLKNRIGRKSLAIQNQFDKTFKQISEMKIQLELSQIVEKVNNNTMKKYDALQRVYDLYTKANNNVRVCENLATLIPMCVMEYIVADKLGKGKVRTVLNALKLNASYTFLTHNSGIGEAYNTIWNQLPYDARRAIENYPSTLNEQGRNLKEGLDYLKALK